MSAVLLLFESPRATTAPRPAASACHRGVLVEGSAHRGGLSPETSAQSRPELSGVGPIAAPYCEVLPGQSSAGFELGKLALI